MIILVRHGETAPNRSRQLLGRADPPLTPHGREQARRAADALAGLSPARIISSPLLRANETAEAIAETVGVTVEIDDRLVEMNYGDWDGKSFGDLDPVEHERWRSDSSMTPPGGESLDEVGRRVAALCEELVGNLGRGPVIVISHVSPIKAAVIWALGAQQLAAWRMFLDLASISRIGVGPLGPLLLGFNDTTHLGPR